MANEFKIKNGLISDGDVVVTGSITATGGINISGSIASAQTASFAPSYTLTSSFNSYTSSASSSLGGLSGSVATTTSNLSSSIENLSSSVATTTLNLSSSVATTTLNLSSSIATTTSGLSGRISIIEGRGATTGSNTFIGTQTITGSLFISSDLIVQGSSSLQNITASAVNIGANIVNLNTANPAIRFAGMSIFDSGSIGGSGSFLYDSVQDEFIFVHRGDNANITSSVALMGPQTYNNVGSELYPTNNRVLKGTGNEHVGDSCIIDDGTNVTINANLRGCGLSYFSGTVGIATENSIANLTVKENESCRAVVLYGRTSDNLARIDFFRADETCFAGRIQMDNGTTSNMSVRAQGNIRLQTGGSADRLTITNTGESTFACSVTTNVGIIGNNSNHLYLSSNSATGEISFWGNQLNTRLMTLDACGRLGLGCSTPGTNLQVNGGADTNIRVVSSAGGFSAIQFGDTLDTVRGAISYNNGDDSIAIRGYNNDNRLLINSAGGACFSNQVCAPVLVTSQCAVIGANSYNALYFRDHGWWIGLLSSANNPWADADSMVFNTVSGTTGDDRPFVFQKGGDGRTCGCVLMYINSDNGRVGIGETSPMVRLHVNGTIGTGTPANGWGRFSFCDGTNTVNIQSSKDGIDPTNIAFWTQASGGAFSERMRITSAGFVGIGATSPVTNLHICNNTNAGIRIQASASNGSSELDLLSHGTQSSFIDFGPNQLRFRSTNCDMTAINNGSVLVLNNCGCVGIGTSTPTEKLVVSETTTPSQISLKQETNFNSGTIGQLNYIGGGTGSKSAMIESNRVGGSATNAFRGGDLRFYTKVDDTFDCLVERIRITSAGRVSVGITDPIGDIRMDIRSTCSLTSPVGQPLFIGSSDTTGPLGIVIQHICGNNVCRVDITSTRYGVSGNDLSLNIDSGNPNAAGGLYIKYRGNVGIGTSSPSINLHVSGCNSNAVGSSTFWNFAFSGAELTNTSNCPGTVSALALIGGSSRGSVSAIANVLETTGAGQLAFFTGGGSTGTVPERLRISSAGISCFACTICTGGHIIPLSNGTQDLGTASNRWCTVYTSDISLNNGIGNYTIVEGENDLFIYNNNSCKVFKFLLQEVCPETAPKKLSK